MCLYCTREPNPELLKDRAVLSRISSDILSTFLWMTLTDKIVNPFSCLEYTKLLHQAGVNCELHLFESGK